MANVEGYFCCDHIVMLCASVNCQDASLASADFFFSSFLQLPRGITDAVMLPSAITDAVMWVLIVAGSI